MVSNNNHIKRGCGLESGSTWEDLEERGNGGGIKKGKRREKVM